ncbi:uncharacterized protein LOC125239361 isoform X2 [Leguminivora glycinivorella]|uniref:uncharacterized protein LOC125239361 isoform X2 n=1 Tax=Leguminivora glycinivorella TaxID=1035111 RepID=UPI002010020D|nr:uncharacterized protein LOC125239361 isoform X2 [Leguminivora glycinivorella]
MLRTVLLSVFLPTMMSANQKQPYLYRMPLDPNAKAVPPYTDKLEMYPEKNVIKGRTSNLKDIYLNEYTFTAKPIEPVNAQPVSRAGEIKQKSNKNVPGFIIKSVDLKNNDVIKNEVNINDIFSKVKPSQIHRIKVPLISDPVNVPKQNVVPHVLPGLSKNQLQESKKIPGKFPINEYIPLTQRPLKWSIPIETLKTVIKPANKPEDAKNRFSSLTEEMLNPLPLAPKLSNLNKDSMLKEKLVSLLLSSRKDLEKQVKDLQSIHEALKSETMYKIGYLTSHMNKMNKQITTLYKNVQNNHHNLDSLQILEAYEKVKGKDLTQRPATKSFLRAKKPAQRKKKRKKPSGSPLISLIKPISWAYYDD